MPTVTQNYGIKKPIKGEKYDLVTINDNADIIDESIKEVDDRISNIIAQSGTSDTEVVDARGGFTVLNDRLDNSDVQLSTSKVMATNLVTTGDFSNGTTGWSAQYATLSLDSGFAKLTSSNVAGAIRLLLSSLTLSTGIKYYISLDYKTDNYATLNYVGVRYADKLFNKPLSGGVSKLSQVLSLTQSATLSIESVHTSFSATEPVAYFNKILIINLTALFGAGNEPTKEQMDWIFTERDRLGLGHLNGTAELLPMVSLLNLINKKASKTQEAKTTPTLTNGWTGTAQYFIDEFGIGHFVGNVKTGTLGQPFTTLLVGDRPLTITPFIVNANNTVGYGYIDNLGRCYIVSAGSTNPVYLDSVTWLTF